MITEARRKKIIELIEREGVVNLQQLTDSFDVSIYTIRRDLTDLEKKGLLKKTHGGAVRVEKTKWIPTMESGKTEAVEEKKCIAVKAAELVSDGDTIMLMGSTIALYMIPLIKHKTITIVTNSLDIAKELSLFENIETILIGGRIKNYKGNILGSRAVDEIRNYHFDKAFLPCAGIEDNMGISTSTIDSADFLSAVVESTNQNIVIADYRKIGRITFAKVCTIEKIDMLITDERSDKETLAKLVKKGLKIEIAKEV
ncbi:MAG: DeoR/GlpR family DNA-binding transcription regulator [Bacillota bacterium]